MGGGLRLYATQLAVLTQKTFLLAVRNWKQSLGQILAPLLIVLLLLAFQGLANLVLSRDNPHPPTSEVGNFPRCWDRNTRSKAEDYGTECKSVVYAPKGVAWVEQLMRTVALDNSLDFDRDFVAMQAPGSSLNFFADNSTIYNYIIDNPNTTQIAIIFQSAYSFTGGTPNPKIPPEPGYILFYNVTEAKSNNNDSPAIHFVKSLDRAILLQQSNLTNVTLDVNYRSYPRAKTRISQYDVVASDGGVWFYVPPMVIFFILLTEVVTEKEQRLRLGMRMMGMKDSVYWLVWIMNGFIFQVLSTLVLIVSGSAAQFKFFTNADFGVLFVMFLCFGLAIQSVAFFLSTLISKSKTAQTAGYAAVLIGFVFQAILCGGYGLLVDLLYDDTIRTWIKFVRWGFTIYPPFNFAKIYSDVASLSANEVNFANGNIASGPGFHWKDLYNTRNLDASFIGLGNITIPAPVQSIYLLLGDIFFYLLLAWYFDNVLPGEHGSPRPFYFFLTPSYWGFKNNKPIDHSEEDEFHQRSDGSTHLVTSQDEDEDVENERKRTLRGDSQDAAVRVVQLEKVYQKHLWKSSKDFKAVDKVTFTVERGEIFCLLGHNGAGKTTTINMLTGLFPASAGRAYINGMDASNNMDEIRREMGVTPQHDILWPELTALEHLRLFAKLKGFAGSAAEAEIQIRLSKMGLWDVRNHRVRTFSGGMKRRLSVAIATIGGPSIIFMDEPSTGMDPVNRRHMWELIQDLKQEASIILTTHSMEEAQNLADRITIMAHGKMRCLGNSLHLKNKFGKGYRLEIMTELIHVEKIVRDLRSICPDLQLNRCDAGNLLLDIPANSPEHMGSLIRYLEDNSPDVKGANATLREFGISHSTLEEVFLEVTRRNNFSYDEDEGEEYQNGSALNSSSTDYAKVSTSEYEERVTSDHRSSRPLSALLLKNLSLQKRQMGTNICQIVTPVLVMLILLVLQLVVKSELGDSLGKPTLVNTIPYAVNALGVSGSNFPNQPSCYQSFWFDDEEGTGEVSRLLNLTTRIGCRLRNGTRRFIPEFLPRASLENIDKELYHNQEIYNGLPTRVVDRPPINYLLPDGFFLFKEIEWQNEAVLKYTFSINDLPLKSYHRSNGISRVSYFEGLDGLVLVEGKVAAMTMIHHTYSRLLFEHGGNNSTNEKRFQPETVVKAPKVLLREDYKLIKNQIPLHGISRYFSEESRSKNVTFSSRDNTEDSQERHENVKRDASGFTIDAIRLRYLQAMPYKSNFDILGMLEIVGTLLFPIALSIQLPIYLYILVMEKGGPKELMKSHGMKTSSYILSNYIFNFILFFIVAVFFWGTGAAMSLRLFKQTHPALIFALLFGWGNAMIALAFFLSTFIDTTRTATVVGYVVALMGSLIGILFCAGIYGFGLPYSINAGMPLGYFLVPQFAFIRALYLMNYQCTQKLSCYGAYGSVSQFFNDELGQSIIFLFADFIIYMILALYLEAVWPRAYGVPKHPLFFLGMGRTPKHVSTDTEVFVDEDEDVSSETQRVKSINSEDTKEYPLIIRNLRKVFPSPAKGKPQKVAVRGLHLAVPRGECFGLLGENGAGKTTTISIVTGLITPTSGTATVVGHDIRTDIGQVHLNIGICPQFSVLWDGLTVEEHLLFYARLKGIPRSTEKSHVDHCLQQYGLSLQRGRKARDLSGGMQRRLSVAIALVGDSQIVFLDEPTTGLDPASKRQLWRIISDAKVGRAIILTTHSMEEAELLCSRIGIIALGQMRCVGTPLRLKNKFTEGYGLEINYDPADAVRVEDSMNEMFDPKTCQEVATFRGTKEYRIVGKERLSEVFERMVKQSKSMGINAWSLSQSGLEDVFQNIVENSK